MIKLLTGALSAATGAAGTAGSFLGGIKVYLIIAAVCGLLGTAGGFYWGTTHQSKILAKAATQAAEIARKSQAEKDAKDWAAAKKDYEARLAAGQASNAALEELLKKKPKVVYKVVNGKEVPAIAKESMKALNDPALVGETR